MTLQFFLLAFAITWGSLLPFLVLPHEVLRALPTLFPLFLVSRFGPSLAGLASAGLVGGLADVRALLGRLLPRWSQGGWIVAALLAPPAGAVAATAWTALGQVPLGPTDAHALATFGPHFVGALLLGGGLGEELGWRGFALPRLQRRLAPLPATLVLGLLWAVWRWPLFRLEEAGRPGATPFPLAAAGLLGLAVLLTWVYNGSGGSLLACVLFRVGVTASARTLERAVPLLWTNGVIDAPLAGVYLLLALFVIAGTRGRLGAPEP